MCFFLIIINLFFDYDTKMAQARPMPAWAIFWLISFDFMRDLL
tara:strand:+ start:43 stop:171 length:129 start_codon:yes stop_codon:yes gene_type:complete